MRLPPLKPAAAYLLEVDGVWLPIPLSRHMIVAVHANGPGVRARPALRARLPRA